MTAEAALAALAAFDRAALLVTADLSTVALPLLLEGDRLVGHVARANPIWRLAPCAALVICRGPETYVSPNWYPSKQQTHRVVPTWDYVTLEARGALRVFDDPARLESVVRALSDRHEAQQATPWRLEDAPRNYIEAMLGAIVGVEINVESLHGVAKLSLNKSAPDRAGVVQALQASQDPRDRAVAEAILKAEPDQIA